MYRLFLFIFITFFLIFVYFNREKITAIALPFILGILIAYILNPIVEFLIKKKINRTAAVAIIYFILISSLIVSLIYIVPIFILELNNLMDAIPFYSREVQKVISEIKVKYLSLLPVSVKEIAYRNIEKMEDLLLVTLQKIVDSIIGIFSSIFSIILGPILGFYILKDMEKIKKNLILHIPIPYRNKVAAWFEKFGKTLGDYIRSQLIVCFIIGVSTTIFMILLGIDYAFIIGALAGLTNIIPYFGPFIGAMPAVAIAILRYPDKIPWIIISMLAIHQVESGIISPHIIGEHVGLHPVTVIFSLLIGGSFFGLVGLILAVPVAALIKLTLQNRKLQ